MKPLKPSPEVLQAREDLKGLLGQVTRRLAEDPRASIEDLREQMVAPQALVADFRAKAASHLEHRKVAGVQDLRERIAGDRQRKADKEALRDRITKMHEGKDKMTFEAIGNAVGLSRGRVWQLYKGKD